MTDAHRLQQRAPDRPRRRLQHQLLRPLPTPAIAVPVVTATHGCGSARPSRSRAPVILTIGFEAWRILPTTQVVGAPSATQPQFEQTRAATPPPEDVGGDLKLATFNVLNYFPTPATSTSPPVSAPARTSPTARATRSRTTRCNPQRSARCGEPGQPGAPAGQDRQGDQHRRRRHRLPRGARELGPSSTSRRDFAIDAAGHRPERRRRRRHLGLRCRRRRRPTCRRWPSRT